MERVLLWLDELDDFWALCALARGGMRRIGLVAGLLSAPLLLPFGKTLAAACLGACGLLALTAATVRACAAAAGRSGRGLPRRLRRPA